MRILRHADQRAVPWKNGGGLTREIAAAPDPDGVADFLWRVSIATVRAPGPFSRFDGVDRTIAVVRGSGIILEHGNGEAITLTGAAPPYRFAGETAIFAAVIAGETLDLNAMSRRGRARHDMRRLTIAEPTEFPCTAEVTILVAAGTLTLRLENQDHDLSTGDAAIGLPPGTRMSLSARTPADAYIVEIST